MQLISILNEIKTYHVPEFDGLLYLPPKDANGADSLILPEDKQMVLASIRMDQGNTFLGQPERGKLYLDMSRDSICPGI